MSRAKRSSPSICFKVTSGQLCGVVGLGQQPRARAVDERLSSSRESFFDSGDQFVDASKLILWWLGKGGIEEP